MEGEEGSVGRTSEDALGEEAEERLLIDEIVGVSE
jgi:hypothetical protein